MTTTTTTTTSLSCGDKASIVGGDAMIAPAALRRAALRCTALRPVRATHADRLTAMLQFRDSIASHLTSSSLVHIT